MAGGESFVSASMATSSKQKDIVSPLAPSVCPSELSTAAPSEGGVFVGRVENDPSDIDEHDDAFRSLEEQVSDWAEVGERLSLLFEQLNACDLESDDDSDYGSLYRQPRLGHPSKKGHSQFSAILGVAAPTCMTFDISSECGSDLEQQCDAAFDTPVMSHRMGEASQQDDNTCMDENRHETAAHEESQAWNALLGLSRQSTGTSEPEAKHQDTRHATGCRVQEGLNSWCVLGSQLAKVLQAVGDDENDDWD